MEPQRPPAPALPNTIQGHIDLLEQKGYLADNFGGVGRIGQWILEFQERFEAVRYNATADKKKKKKKFSVHSKGRFNEHLDNVSFYFRYQYDPQRKSLSLLSIRGRLDDLSRSWLLNGRLEPPTPTDAYEEILRQNQFLPRNSVLARVKKEIDRQNDPFNDPHLDMYHPGFDRTNDLHQDPEFRESPPNDLTSFYNRPRNRPR